ncbi:MAG: Phosphoglycolate phosphatase [Elusimicrobia bacterium]|nr:Phosphoglycolate phosphatase [Elusimicrobiota bacterium]
MTVLAIAFDLDDTLVHSGLAYQVALKRIGLKETDAVYVQARNNVKKKLGARHVCARNRLLYFKEILDIRNHYTPDRLLKMMEHYEKALSMEIKRQWLALRRDALMKRLSRRIPLVVLSNENTRTQLIKMKAIDPQASYFKTLITSESVGHEKPHVAMFQKASEVLKIPFQHILMVGDNMKDDILPALRLKMKAVLTREFSQDYLSHHMKNKISILSNLDDLESFLK